MGNLISQACERCVAEKERLIRAAITSKLGHENWSPEEISSRIKWVMIGNVELIYLDWIPLIEFSEFKTWMGEDLRLNISFSYRHY